MGTVYAKEVSMETNNRSLKEDISNKEFRDQNEDDSSAFFGVKNNMSKPQKSSEVKQIDLQGLKVRVDKIHVDGLIRTKDDIVKSQVTELFKAKDFQDVIVRTYKVRGKLESLGCFQSVGVYIDTSQGPEATPDGVEITFTVREMKRLMGGINTMVGNNEGSVSVGAKAMNLFGRGERVQMEYSHGTKNTTNLNISAVKPFVNSWLQPVLTCTVFSTMNDFPWSGYNQSDKGLLLDLAFGSNKTRVFKNNVQYEATYRKIAASKQATFDVREQCGPNLKSALRHICSVDKRDSTIFPKAGSFLQFSTELAGLGGDIGFVKNEFLLQTNWTPHEWLTFQVGLQSGLLRTIGNELKINIADHFFLGGPMNLRGFDTRGCGPHSNGNSLGGDAYWAIALHLYTPLPFRPGRNSFGNLFRLHGFINGGNVSILPTNLANGYKQYLEIFTKDVRCAAGGGIAIRIGNIARVELNLIMPLLLQRSDVLQQLQFGIGVQYL